MPFSTYKIADPDLMEASGRRSTVFATSCNCLAIGKLGFVSFEKIAGRHFQTFSTVSTLSGPRAVRRD